MPKKPNLHPARPEKITEYPKWVNGNLVNSAEEERALGVPASPQPTPTDSAPTPYADALKTGTIALSVRLNIPLPEGQGAEEDLEVIAMALEGRAKAAFGERDTSETTGDGADEDRVGGQSAPYTEIPDGWRELHHSTLRKLARDLSGAEVASTEEAVAIVERELTRRGDGQ